MRSLEARFPVILLAVAAIAIAACGCGERAKVERPVTVKVAILPEYSLPAMMQRYAPLIARLQESLGPRYRVEWISCPSQEAYLATVERERPVLSIQDAYHSALLAKLQDATIVLQTVNRDGSPLTRGVVITPANGALTSFDNARIAVPSRRSFLGFIEQAQEMEGGGVDPNRCRFVSFHWQDEVVKQVARGEVQAGFVGEDAVGPGVRVIARTHPVPSACAVIFPNAPPDIARKLCVTLSGLSMGDPQCAPVLEGIGITGFRPVDAASVERIRSLADSRAIPY